MFAQAPSGAINAYSDFRALLQEIKTRSPEEKAAIVRQVGADIATFKSQLAQFETQIKHTEDIVRSHMSRGERISKSLAIPELTITVGLLAGLGTLISGAFVIGMTIDGYGPVKRLLLTSRTPEAWIFWSSTIIGSAVFANFMHGKMVDAKLRLAAGKELDQISQLKSEVEVLKAKIAEREKFNELMAKYMILSNK